MTFDPGSLVLIVIALLELSLVSALAIGRLGLRAAVTTIAILGLAGVFWVWPAAVSSVIPDLHASEGSYVLFDFVVLIIIILASALAYSTGTVRRHLVSLTRDMALCSLPPVTDPKGTGGLTALRLAVVIPAKNEEQALPGVLAALKEMSMGVDLTIIVVDDGSRDKTRFLARAAGAITVHHAYGLGIGAALTTGFLASLQYGPDVVVQLDADGQHDIGQLPNLIAPIVNGTADLCIATRFGTKGPRHLSLTRRLGIGIYTGLVSWLSGYRLTDLTSGYRAVRAERLRDVLFLAEANWAIEMTIRAGRAKLRLAEVPIANLKRVGGKSQFHDISTFFTYHARAISQIYRAIFLETSYIPGEQNPGITLDKRSSGLIGHPEHEVAESIHNPGTQKLGTTTPATANAKSAIEA